MWPFSADSSRVLGVPDEPKLAIKLEDFETSDRLLDATLTPDIWEAIEWLSSKTDTTYVNVVRGLLFKALYGRIAYEQLAVHAKQRQADHRPQPDELQLPGEIRKSADRASQVDVDLVGKSTVKRKFAIPNRMWIDLDRQSSKAAVDLTTYVRQLLFRELQGEVIYNQWQNARADFLNRVKPL